VLRHVNKKRVVERTVDEVERAQNLSEDANMLL
jgi:hypothetical protein